MGQWEKTNGPVKNVNVRAYAFKDNMVFAATTLNDYGPTSFGRVYRSATKGDHWEDASSGLPLGGSLFISSLAAAPPYIYAGTNSGVWRSADNGDHWVSITNDLPDTIIEAVGATDNLVFAFTTSSVYRSDNFGASWAVCFDGSSSMHDYNSFIRVGSTLFFCDSYTGIFRSPDNGLTWQYVYSSTGCSLTIAALDSYLFASTCNGLMRSADNGSTWTVVNDSMLVWRMAAQGSSLFTGGYGYFSRSDDYGNSWISVTNGIPLEYIITMDADNSSVYVGNYTGNYRTDNKGTR